MDKKASFLTAVEITGKTFLSAIPVGGALISNVYEKIKGNILEKRLDKWKGMVEERLSRLEHTLDEIGENDTFATLLIKMTELAIKTEKEEKLNYLADALVNSVEHTLDEDKLIIFMSFVEKHTTVHIKILKYFYDPSRYNPNVSNLMMGSPSALLFKAFPECEPLSKKCIKDLFNDELLTLNELNTVMTAQGMISKRTTALADEYLNFLGLTDK